MGDLSEPRPKPLRTSAEPCVHPAGDDEITTFQEAVLNKVSEGLCVCHNIEEYPYVRFTVWNEKMEALTGYSRDEINRLGWYQTVYPDPEVRDRAIARMDKMRSGNDLKAEEWTITTAEDQKRIVEISTSVLHCEHGHTHVFAMFEDVTEKRDNQRRQAKLQEQMARAEKMESLGLLAGGVAHDLNNILGPVIGYADLLLRTLDETDTRLIAKVQKIKKSAADAAEVVQDLLTLARRGRCELSPVNIVQIIEECKAAPWYTDLRDMNPGLHLEVAVPETSISILASPTHIKKAIMNLVRNAVDAMPTGGTLTIDVRTVSGDSLPKGCGDPVKKYVSIAFRDTGHGIEPESLPKIFEPYFSKKSLGKSNGSGLGLAVVYGVLKDHNGVYDVKSTVGSGTEFTLFFPTCEESAKQVSDHNDSLRGSETVLVIDDDPSQRDMAKDMLESLGYAVLTATDGRQAVRLVADETVDLVVLDMIMEDGYDGLDTYKAIRQLRPSQKAIIVTGYAETERVRQACELGVSKSVRKPYTLDLIGRVLRSVLDQP